MKIKLDNSDEEEENREGIQTLDTTVQLKIQKPNKN